MKVLPLLIAFPLGFWFGRRCSRETQLRAMIFLVGFELGMLVLHLIGGAA